MKSLVLLAVLAAGVTAALLVALIGNVSASYGLALFVAAPFCIGVVAGVLANYRERRSLSGTFGIALATTGVAAASVLLWRIEGLVCIVMASPLILLLVWRARRSGVRWRAATGRGG